MPAVSIRSPLCAMNNNEFSQPESPTEEFILQAQGLHKSFFVGKRKLEILRGISMNVRPGEFIALCGASGAGKSTLLNLLAGLDTPDEGHVILSGKRTDQLSDRELTQIRNRQIGFIFQSYHLLPEFDALENVSMPARIARRPYRETIEEAEQLLCRVGLEERIEHRPPELSGGEQQRVAIARALINHPSLLIADEPTGNLDSKTGREILDLLLQLRSERRCALVMATHDTGIADQADHTFHIVDGRLLS